MKIYKKHAKRGRPEEQIYIDFVLEFSFRFRKHLKFLFRFEHGGYVVSFAEQNVRKKTLLKPGIADYGLFVESQGYKMLWLEFKAGRNKLTPSQEDVKALMEAWGAKCVACWSAKEGMEAVASYLKGRP